jgi:hypothetical protein
MLIIQQSTPQIEQRFAWTGLIHHAENLRLSCISLQSDHIDAG